MIPIHFRYVLHFSYTDEEKMRDDLYLDKDTRFPWVRILEDIFGNPTKNFDGYVHSVDFSINWEILSGKLDMDFYIIEKDPKLEQYRLSVGENWDISVNNLIKELILKKAQSISSICVNKIV